MWVRGQPPKWPRGGGKGKFEDGKSWVAGAGFGARFGKDKPSILRIRNCGWRLF
jgi:hypothetical protein